MIYHFYFGLLSPKLYFPNKWMLWCYAFVITVVLDPFEFTAASSSFNSKIFSTKVTKYD